MEFKPAKLDRIATIISVSVSLLLVGLSLFFLIKVPFGWVFAIVIMLILVVCYLLSPKRYSFEGTNLVLEKVIGRKAIIRSDDIEGYVRIPDFTKLTVARTFGNGGLFGYYGMFTTAEYGTINCQLTNLKGICVIKTKKGTFALSPAERERFEEHLQTLTAEIKTIEPRVVEKREYARPLILLVPIALFVITILMVLLNYAQLPERIAVHFDFQGNPDRWGSKISYLTSGIIPASVLLAIGIGAFFFVRRTTPRKALPNFLVLIVAFIQLFIAYVSFDTYWVSKYNTHLLPLWYSFGGFAIVLILLFIYYRRIVKKTA